MSYCSSCSGCSNNLPSYTDQQQTYEIEPKQSNQYANTNNAYELY